jgi:hypothetical protein
MRGTFVTEHIAAEALGVLKARDAEMDERALEAPQKAAGKGGNGSTSGAFAAGILRRAAA